MDQISFDDIERESALAKMPGRTTFIDECGNFGFDFESGGSSEKYVLCAVVAKNADLPRLHSEVEAVKNKNGYPPQYSPEVFRKVMEQVENFEENN